VDDRADQGHTVVRSAVRSGDQTSMSGQDLADGPGGDGLPAQPNHSSCNSAVVGGAQRKAAYLPSFARTSRLRAVGG